MKRERRGERNHRPRPRGRPEEGRRSESTRFHIREPSVRRSSVNQRRARCSVPRVPSRGWLRDLIRRRAHDPGSLLAVYDRPRHASQTSGVEARWSRRSRAGRWASTEGAGRRGGSLRSGPPSARRASGPSPRIACSLDRSSPRHRRRATRPLRSRTRRQPLLAEVDAPAPACRAQPEPALRLAGVRTFFGAEDPDCRARPWCSAREVYAGATGAPSISARPRPRSKSSNACCARAASFAAAPQGTP